MEGHLYSHVRHICKDIWVRYTAFMSLQKTSGCRHSWRERIITDKMPKAQEVLQIHWKSLMKRQVQLISAETLLTEEFSVHL